MKTSIVFTGVGGQGVITAANILGKAAVKANVNVYASEVHGMAQRGGSVYCTVRMGNVSSPLVASGTADVLIGMEPIEALRYIHFAYNGTKVVTDCNPVVPFTATVSKETYPDLEDVYKEIRSRAILYIVNALEIAKKAGSAITKNSVMLGTLVATEILPFDSEILLETIMEAVPSASKTVNKNAFHMGMQALKEK